MPDPVLRTRELRWSPPPLSPRSLRRAGFRVLPWRRLARTAARARAGGTRRRTLANPAAGLLGFYARHGKVALTGVPAPDLEVLRVLLGYGLEPAYRAGCTLVVEAAWTPATLDAADLHDPEWRCPWTWERLRDLAARYAVPAAVPAPPPVPWWRRRPGGASHRGDGSGGPAPRLDPQQNAAVAAGDGIVQVIAPAGSGKTTVLVERVRELHRRGTPAGRILCTSFNRDACVEMKGRLARAGLDGVQVRSFHGLGLAILREAGRLRGQPGEVSAAWWEAVAAQAALAEPDCGPFGGAEAAAAVAGFKLEAMLGPQDAWAAAVHAGPPARAAARAYALHEERLRRAGRLDFDDLIFRSVELLQQDAAVRRRWQDRCRRVLVDEYQDIEPAQALLVGLLAAPEDSLFCVGDEDQCIYAWRRAAVERVIALDLTYPGLERYPLVRNYRCGRTITLASRRLIGHNRQRFRKPLRPGVQVPGRVSVWACRDLAEGARFAAGLAAGAAPGSTAVLARSGALLRAVAAAGPADAELATVHGSKGREWDRVVIFGADEGRFPLGRALRDGALEDERRLFYVALTRARRELDIVCSERAPSRFLREAGLKPRPARRGR